MTVPLRERFSWFFRTYLKLAVNKFRRDGLWPTLIATTIVLRRLYKRHIVGPVLASLAKRQLVLRDELRQRARAADRYWELDDSGGYESVTAPEACLAPNPFHDHDLPGHIQQTVTEPFHFETPFVTDLSDAMLVGPSPAGFTQEGEILHDTIGLHSHNTRFERELVFFYEEYGLATTLSILLTGVSEPEKTIECGCLLTSNDRSYGHWISEHVDKLRAVERYEAATGTQPTLILEKNPPAWKREYLDIFGYDEGDWVEWDVDTMRVKQLVLPSAPHYTIPGCTWLREHVLAETTAIDDTELSSRVFISREKAAKKRIENRDAVVAVLEQFGFEKYVLEDMSVRKQAALFADAEYVVAPTGSGLHNIVYSEDVSILELVPHKQGNAWYRLSRLLGFDHEHLFGRPSEEDPMGRNYFTVDTEELETRVRALVSD